MLWKKLKLFSSWYYFSGGESGILSLLELLRWNPMSQFSHPHSLRCPCKRKWPPLILLLLYGSIVFPGHVTQHWSKRWKNWSWCMPCYYAVVWCRFIKRRMIVETTSFGTRKQNDAVRLRERTKTACFAKRCVLICLLCLLSYGPTVSLGSKTLDSLSLLDQRTAQRRRIYR